MKYSNTIRTRNSLFTTLIIMCCIIALGSILRFYKLSYAGFWYDEAYSILRAENIKHYFARHIIKDKHPPLYYTLLHFWMSLFGDSEWSARMLSALPSIMSIALIFVVGRDIFDTKVGIVSALLLALSPLHIWYAQEARGYSVSVLFTLILLYSYFRIRDTGRRERIHWIILCSSMVALLYTGYYSFIIIIPLIISLFDIKINKKKLIFMLFFLTIFIIPVCLLGIPHVKSLHNIFWIPQPHWYTFLIVVANFILGFNATAIMYKIALFILFGVIILWFVNFKKYKNNTIILYLIIVPLSIAYIFSQWFPIFITRQLLPISSLCYILMSQCLVHVVPRLLKPGISIVFLGLIINALFNYYMQYMPAPERFHFGVHVKKPYRQIIRLLKDNIAETDFIAHSSPSTVYPLLFYLKDIYTKHLYLAIPDKQYPYEKEHFVPHHLKRSDNLIVKRFGKEARRYPGKRLWLISADWSRDGSLDIHSHAVLQRAYERFDHVEHHEFDGVYVDLFSMG